MRLTQAVVLAMVEAVDQPLGDNRTKSAIFVLLICSILFVSYTHIPSSNVPIEQALLENLKISSGSTTNKSIHQNSVKNKSFQLRTSTNATSVVQVITRWNNSTKSLPDISARNSTTNSVQGKSKHSTKKHAELVTEASETNLLFWKPKTAAHVTECLKILGYVPSLVNNNINFVPALAPKMGTTSIRNVRSALTLRDQIDHRFKKIPFKRSVSLADVKAWTHGRCGYPGCLENTAALIKGKETQVVGPSQMTEYQPKNVLN